MCGDPRRVEEHGEVTVASIADMLSFCCKVVRKLVKRGKVGRLHKSPPRVKSLMSLKSQVRLISFIILAGILLSQSMIIAQNVTKLVNGSMSNVSESSNIGSFKGNETLTTTTTVNLETNTSTTSTQITTVPPSIADAELLVSVNAPSDVVRGEEVRIVATITNVGNVAKDIDVTWNLATGFEIIGKSDECERLNPDESCEVWVLVKTSHSTQLGENEIGVVVTYG